MSFINGREYDHSSHRIRILGVAWPGVESINYAHGRDGSAYVHGTSSTPVARTRGQYKPDDVSIEMAKSQWDQLRTLLGAIGWMERVFDVIVEAEEIPGPGVSVDTLKSCKIKKVDHSSGAGGAASMVKLTIECMMVLESGTLPMLDLNIPVQV